MSLFDFLLNLAGLLLWLSWRSVRLDPMTRATPATLAGTLKRAEPPRLKRWHFLAALGMLLLLRSVIYGQIGPSANWTPRLNLFVVALAFPLIIQGQVFYLSALIFSLLSFLRIWVIFYFWLLALTVINRRSVTATLPEKMIAQQLGPAARWPLPVQLAAPLFFVAALWMGLHAPLLGIGAVGHARSAAVLIEQGALVGLGLYLSLKLLLPALLLLKLVTTYVFLGNHPFWEFVDVTARRMVAPLNRLPLRIGRMDIAPLLGIALVLLCLYTLPNFLLQKFIIGPPAHEGPQHFHSLWPQ